MSKNRYPGATWAPIPEHGEQGQHTKTQLIFHSTGTTASAAANRRYFAREDIKVESTLIVDYDGGCLQLLEAYERADANTTASARAISVEVVGKADEPFTPAQLARCRDIARWACDEHPIARRQIPEHDRPGIGWHVMFGAPGPWTTVRGKQCPGAERIVQVRDDIIPSVRPAPATKPSPTLSPAPAPAPAKPAVIVQEDTVIEFRFKTEADPQQHIHLRTGRTVPLTKELLSGLQAVKVAIPPLIVVTPEQASALIAVGQ